jgi:secondary thiamine-phosphate synthase enzyme
VKSRQREELVEFTDVVRQKLQESGVRDGIVLLYTQHTTAGLTINENADPDVKHDMLKKLEALVPRQENYYRHAEGNSDSHVKASLFGQSVTVLLERGRLLLGQWQGVYLCEFDGPRPRSVLVKVVET